VYLGDINLVSDSLVEEAYKERVNKLTLYSLLPQHDRGRSEDIPVRARQLKERHKGSHGNHNRKDLADKKRRRGMGAPPRT